MKIQNDFNNDEEDFIKTSVELNKVDIGTAIEMENNK